MGRFSVHESSDDAEVNARGRGGRDRSSIYIARINVLLFRGKNLVHIIIVLDPISSMLRQNSDKYYITARGSVNRCSMYGLWMGGSVQYKTKKKYATHGMEWKGEIAMMRLCRAGDGGSNMLQAMRVTWVVYEWV